MEKNKEVSETSLSSTESPAGGAPMRIPALIPESPCFTARKGRFVVAAAMVLALATTSRPAYAQVGTNKLVSVVEPGDTTAGNVAATPPVASFRAHISDDGNIVIWQSLSSNITSATDRNCSVRTLAPRAAISCWTSRPVRCRSSPE